MNEAEKLAAAHEARAELTQTGRAFDLLKQAMLEEIATSAAEETGRREQLYHGVQALQKVRKMLLLASQEADMADYRQSLAEAGF